MLAGCQTASDEFIFHYDFKIKKGNSLKHTLNNFEIDSNVGEYYKGKVRDNYHMDDKILMVTSDRVSAFDHVLGTIPFKGQILTEIANFWFDKTKDIVPNHIISSPDPQVLMAKKAKTLPVEIIIRQYITGSLWREYSSGINGQYGFDFAKATIKLVDATINLQLDVILLLDTLTSNNASLTNEQYRKLYDEICSRVCILLLPAFE